MDNSNYNNYKIKTNKIIRIIIWIITAFLVLIMLFNNYSRTNNEIKSSYKRKQESISQLKKEGIDYNKGLPVIEDSSEIALRSKAEILSRAIASYFVSNVAIDYNWHKENIEESKKVFGDLIDKFGVKESLTEDEKIMLYGNPTDEVALNVEWTIESSKVLFWMLGFIENLNYPSQKNVANAYEINNFIMQYDSLEEMLKDAKLIDVEKILDYTDLYFRYHWACVDKSIGNNISIGNLSSDIVYERRRAFEWAIDKEEDWDDFDAST